MELVLFLVMQSVTVILVGFVALFVSLRTGLVGGRPQAAITRPGDARSGSLLFKTDDGYADATRLGVDVDLTVSGPTIRARVTQIFRNPTQDWVEATYVYPLPAGGAVDTLKMVVGDRVIVGDIKERQQARAIYEQARASGRKAALTEQERPNIFTNSVANIGPGETVLVQIEYQEPVHQSGNEFSLRVPMVVAPRYNPAPIVQSVDMRADGGGWGSSSIRSGAGSRPHHAGGARPRAACTGQSDQHHGASATPAFALGEVKSPFHAGQDRKPRRRPRASSGLPTARCRPIAISN